MMLVPYPRRFHDVPAYRPFRGFDELERAFDCDRSHMGFRTDIRDEGDSFLLEADLPGFNKEDIHVDLEDERMTITAKRNSEYEQKDEKGNYVRRERRFGSYVRTFDTEGIDTERITASYRDGVLRLTLPKLPAPKSNTRRLEIE